MEKVSATIKRITFHNEENGFTVARIHIEKKDEAVAAVGYVFKIKEGQNYDLIGEWKNNEKYGIQFNVKEWTLVPPLSIEGIEAYLAGGSIRGIGKTLAHSIVKTFGYDTLRIIETKPERLSEIPSIGKRKVEMIRESWKAQNEVRSIMLFLQSNGVSPAYATKIYKEYGEKSIEKVSENPYRLADEIWGIGFKMADDIAMHLGFKKDCSFRIESGIKYELSRFSEEGHVYAVKQVLVDKTIELLDLPGDTISNTIDNMVRSHSLSSEENAIYLPVFYRTELNTAKELVRIYNSSTIDEDWTLLKYKYKTRTRKRLTVDIASIEEEIGIEYDEIQKSAIETAIKSQIMILTGGPGTGKSTTTFGILKAFDNAGLDTKLAAPTGRAAKRLSEVTGKEAMTIHRLLECDQNFKFKRNKDNPIEADAIIIDEASMIDISLMHALVKAISDGTKVIFVGDTDQLPSVGAGNVLHDLIESDKFPVVCLTKIFRQAQNSRIITNAHLINSGKSPDLSNPAGTDFFFIEEEEPEKVSETIVELVNNRLPKYYKINPENIQVLSPMKNGSTGTKALNSRLQRTLNSCNLGGPKVQIGERIFYIDDKVMQIRNNYSKMVFNGDIGKIVSINDEDKEVVVQFDDTRCSYTYEEMDEIVPAYAITVHKSQGGEYPIVVMPILSAHYILLQRNLLYTGITRAKKVMVIVGSKKMVHYATKNVVITKRNTKLKEKIQNYFSVCC